MKISAHLIRSLLISLLCLPLVSVVAQPPGGPGGPGGPGNRVHTATEAEPLDLVPANRKPPEKSKYTEAEKGEERAITANGLPQHDVGRFPNRDNPNEIRPQAYQIVIPADPEPAEAITFIQSVAGRGGPRPQFQVFGISLDGVLMEPGTAESYLGRPELGWHYDALGGAVPLGLDSNYAHVQPDGNYHYHGLPIGLMKRLGYQPGHHSPMIGWAADGFPIYVMFGYSAAKDATSAIGELKTSYRLKAGERPKAKDAPGGAYDGAFIEDYEYVADLGDLDECNGRFCITPDFPEGTYAYFMTREWPVIPRAFRGTPMELKMPNLERRGRGDGPPPGGPGGLPPR